MFDLLATSAFGLEAVVARELEQLGYDPQVIGPGRILFRGDAAAIARANLWLRTSDRVLVRLGAFEAKDFGALFDRTFALPWEAWIPANAEFPVNGRSLKSQLSSVPACQRMVKKAIVEKLRKAHGVVDLPETGPKVEIEVALLKDEATLTLDTTGVGLHKRGYRTLVGQAPLRETLAAALVLLSFWRPERPLIDPFCGTGTIPIEAALIGRNLAPGLKRGFAAEHWPALAKEIWDRAREEARDLARPSLPERILGTDIDDEALNLARFHAFQAGVEPDIHFQRQAFADLSSKRKYGCLITNPPYAERIGEESDVESLYRSMPLVLRKLPTWSFFILTAYHDFEQLVGRQADRRRKLYNARIECTYYQFHGPRPPKREARGEPRGAAEGVPAVERDGAAAEEMFPAEGAEGAESDSFALPEAGLPGLDRGDADGGGAASDEAAIGPSAVAEPSESPAAAESAAPRDREKPSAPQAKASRPPVVPVFGGLSPKAHEQAEIFRNRLVKLARHLRRFPTRRGITCYRIYERDIPEIPLVVDRYEDHLHIAEFERPHERTPAEHADWLDLMVRTAGEALGVPRKQIFLKERRRQRGDSQYERVGNQAYTLVVNEGGLKFYVNLSDYLDTGLFLDHRQTRAMFRDEARGKHVLNLFAYTGAFTVYAAAGGAASTTTVDLSNTYLDWAAENLILNQLHGPTNRFVRDDALGFLQHDVPRQPYDLAIVDPPTFSNSKRNEEDWDVQRDHAPLLNLLATRMAPVGVVYFSTNFRRFKLNEAELSPAWEIREITKKTIPEDFRNERIHRCWRMVKQAKS